LGKDEGVGHISLWGQMMRGNWAEWANGMGGGEGEGYLEIGRANKNKKGRNLHGK